jgi:hypothetical protein
MWRGMISRLASVMIATAASLCLASDGRSGPVEDCLDAPTIACVTENFAEGADLPLRAVSASDRDTVISWLLRTLRALDHAEEAERVSWREERGAYAPDRAVEIAVARFLAPRARAPRMSASWMGWPIPPRRLRH